MTPEISELVRELRERSDKFRAERDAVLADMTKEHPHAAEAASVVGGYRIEDADLDSRAAEALTSISEQAAHGWQPIETAPCRPLDKHGYGPTILLWAADALQIGFWDDDFGNFYIETSDRHPKPTHWMPMPSAPVSGSTEGGK